MGADAPMPHVSGLRLPSGKKGVIGLIGPKTMEYPKNLSLMEYITKLLGGGAAVTVLFLLDKTLIHFKY